MASGSMQGPLIATLGSLGRGWMGSARNDSPIPWLSTPLSWWGKSGQCREGPAQGRRARSGQSGALRNIRLVTCRQVGRRLHQAVPGGPDPAAGELPHPAAPVAAGDTQGQSEEGPGSGGARVGGNTAWLGEARGASEPSQRCSKELCGARGIQLGYRARP